MFDVFMEYAEAHNMLIVIIILFNASKTKCMFCYKTPSILFDKFVYGDKNGQFMESPICFVDTPKFIGFSIIIIYLMSYTYMVQILHKNILIIR